MKKRKSLSLFCCSLLYCFHLRMQQERPRLPEDVSPDLAFVIQACWVEDPNLRPTFSQIIRMLNSFYFKLSPPSPPSPPLPDTDNNEAAASNGTMSELSVRTRGKFSFLRQLFNAKKNKNSQWADNFFWKPSLRFYRRKHTRAIVYTVFSDFMI